MVSPALFTVVAVLLFSATQHAAHCQEQDLGSTLSLSISNEVVGGVTFCRLFINGRESVFINRPNSMNFEIGASSVVDFINAASRVGITNSGTSSLPANRYQYLLQVGRFRFQEFISEDRSGDMGPATIYTDGETVLLTNSPFFRTLYSQIERNCPSPPPQCNITTVPIMGPELVLNIQCTPMSPGEGNIMELTGSESFEIESGESLTFASNTLRYRRGSTTRQVFENIMDLYVMEDVRDPLTGASGAGRRLSRFTGGSSQVFSGPGVLRVGESQGLGTAFFSSSGSANEEINTAVVDQQLTFVPISGDNIVRISDILGSTGSPPVQLIDLSGVAETSFRMRSFPTATRIAFNNGIVTVSDRFGQVLASLSGYDMLSAFERSRVRSFSGSMNGELPVRGLTLYTNRNSAGLEQAFGFSGIESPVIQNNINTALSQINVPFNTRPRFSAQGLDDGSVIFSADGEETVIATDRAPIRVGTGQFVSYDGMQFRVYPQTDSSTSISGTPITASSFTVFETVPQAPGSYFTRYNQSNVPTQDFAGPGAIYVDSNNRAFFTNDQRTISFIDGFIASQPPSQISTRSRIVNDTRVVNIENGNRRLVEASSSTTTGVGPSQGVIYVNNILRTVNAFSVPSGSRVVDFPSSTPGQRIVQVLSPDGQVQFTTTTSNYRRSEGGVIQPGMVTPNSSLSGGGVIYFNPNGGNVVYSDDTAVSPAFVTEISTTGGINFGSTISNIPELNFFNGQRVIRFLGTSTTLLQGPGTIFTSDTQSLFSTNTVRNRQIAGEISQILPVTFNVNSTTGRFEVISGTGSSVFNFAVGSTRNFNVGGTGSVTYSNGVFVFPGGNISTSAFTFFNGIEIQRFGPGDEVSFMGPGVITVNEETGEIIFITDSSTTQRINNRISSVMNTFRPPVLVRPEATTVTSKFNMVPAMFGQTVNVYESANVMLRCRIREGVPAPTIELYRNGTLLTGSEDRIRIDMTLFETVLTIFGVMPEDQLRYECRTMNSVGRDRTFTDIRVRPSVAPRIEDGYFPVSPDRPGQTITARTADHTVSIIVRDSVPSALAIADERLITDTINVACKAEGLPKAFIEWAAIDGVMEIELNDSTVVVPRPGRSILIVNVSGNADTIRYECTASNAGGEVIGSVTVEAASYTCEGLMATGPCSATCGVGFEELIPRDCFRRDSNGVTMVEASNLPQGLFSSELRPCFTGQPCPVETFEYEGTFGDCSRTCGGGMQMRDLTCQRLVDGVRTNETVDNQICEDFGLIAPPTVQECNIERCPRWMINSGFIPCSSTCAGGTQTRTVTCMQMFIQFNETTGEPILDENGNTVRNDTVVPDSACNEQQMPRRMQNCNEQIPCPHRWFPNPWEPCASDFCQTRTLNCTRFDTSDPTEQWVLNDTFCEGLPEPITVRSCDGGVCNRGQFRVDSRTPCSVTCGVGVENVAMGCYINNIRVSEGFCDFRLRPPSQERCILFNCLGRCDFEPEHCEIFRILRLCKDFPGQVMDCCRSCPLQAMPITLPPLISEDDVRLSVGQRGLLSANNEFDVCCTAMSASNPNEFVFLPFRQSCTFVAEINMELVEMMVFIDRARDNTACASFSAAGLTPGDVIEVTLEEGGLQTFNITVPASI